MIISPEGIIIQWGNSPSIMANILVVANWLAEKGLQKRLIGYAKNF
jgi:hypothetical protein